MNPKNLPPGEESHSLFQPQAWPFFLLFFKIGVFTIGGGYAMIPLIKTEIIERKKWIDENTFVDNLAVAQSIPGPIAVNFSLMTGFRLMGMRGALLGLLGTILPSFLIILLVAAVLWEYQQLPVVQAAFQGIQPMIVALIAAAAFKLGRRVFTRLDLLLIFSVFLALLILYGLHPVFVIIAGGLIGFMRPRFNI